MIGNHCNHGECKHAALTAFNHMSQISGRALEVEKSEFGTQLDFLGAAIHFRYESGTYKADLLLVPDRLAKSIQGATVREDTNDMISVQMQRVAGKLNFAQMRNMVGVGRVALRPFFDSAARGGGKVGPRTIDPACRLQIPPSISPRVIRPLGGEEDVGIYPDACAAGGVLAAVASFTQGSLVLVRGRAHDKLIKSLPATSEIDGIKLFAVLRAVGALGDQLRGKRIIAVLDNEAAVGFSIKASS